MTNVVCTYKSYFVKTCPCCEGTGKIPDIDSKGWYLDYHLQDGHELCGPYESIEAVERYNKAKKSGREIVVLIGPAGYIYDTQE